MRKLIPPVAGTLLTVAFELSIVRGWFESVPDVVVALFWFIPVVLWIWWLYTHEEVKRRRHAAPMISLAIFIIGGGVLGASAGALGWWSLKKQHEHQQTGKLPESPPHDAAREASPDVPTKKVETPTAPTHKMSPPKSESAPVSKGRRLGTGDDAYKDIDDAQVGEWAIEEANKIEAKAVKALADVQAAGRPESVQTQGAVRFFFSRDIQQCCLQAVRDLRQELLRRLGPPAENSDEKLAFEILNKQIDTDGTISVVMQYAPHLRMLGQQLKERSRPLTSQPSGRMITRGDREQIVPILKSHPASVEVMADMSSTESLRFAQDVVDVFKLSGWKTPDGPGQYLPEEHFSGALLLMYGERDTHGTAVTVNAGTPEWCIVEVLRHYGPVSVHKSPAEKRDKIVVEIGMMPER